MSLGVVYERHIVLTLKIKKFYIHFSLDIDFFNIFRFLEKLFQSLYMYASILLVSITLKLHYY